MTRPASRTIVAGLAVWLLWLAYSLLVLQNVLFGVVPGLLVVVGYFAWRLLLAVEELADGVRRLADAQESDESDQEN